MILVIDNFLDKSLIDDFEAICGKYVELKNNSDESIHSISSYFCENGLDCGLYTPEENEVWLKYLSKVNSVVKPFVGDFHGIECWMNVNTNVGWHVDKCEKTFMESNREIHRLCDFSTVYYPYVNTESPYEGRFLYIDHPDFYDSVEDHRDFMIPDHLVNHITPMCNRFIAFSPGLYHMVEPFNGCRTSIAANYWKEPLDLF